MLIFNLLVCIVAQYINNRTCPMRPAEERICYERIRQKSIIAGLSLLDDSRDKLPKDGEFFNAIADDSGVVIEIFSKPNKLLHETVFFYRIAVTKLLQATNIGLSDFYRKSLSTAIPPKNEMESMLYYTIGTLIKNEVKSLLNRTNIFLSNAEKIGDILRLFLTCANFFLAPFDLTFKNEPGGNLKSFQQWVRSYEENSQRTTLSYFKLNERFGEILERYGIRDPYFYALTGKPKFSEKRAVQQTARLWAGHLESLENLLLSCPDLVNFMDQHYDTIYTMSESYKTYLIEKAKAPEEPRSKKRKREANGDANSVLKSPFAKKGEKRGRSRLIFHA